MNTVYNILTLVVILGLFARMAQISLADRGWREREEQEMVARLDVALDAVENEDPAFVAEVRALRDVLVPNAWAMQVGTRSARSNLRADSKIAITRAIYPKPEPAGVAA